MIYEKFYLEETCFSQSTDERLENRIKSFLKENPIAGRNEKQIEELFYEMASIIHEEGFLCAIDWLQHLFMAFAGKEKYD